MDRFKPFKCFSQSLRWMWDGGRTLAYCMKCGSALNGESPDCAVCGNTNPVAVETLPPPRAESGPHLAANKEQIAMASQIATGAAASMQYQSAVQRLCPRCPHQMIVVFRQSRIGWILVVIGIVMTPIPLLGWVGGPIMIIVGIVLWLTKKGKARYQCPNCNYST